MQNANAGAEQKEQASPGVLLSGDSEFLYLMKERNGEWIYERDKRKDIKTESGWIRGRVCENGYAFLGIPYAAPPVGELRWRHPQPVIPWEGIRECFEFGSPCCQAAGQPGTFLKHGIRGKQEGCLY